MEHTCAFIYIQKRHPKYIVQLEHSQYKEYNMQPCKQMFHSNSWKGFESVLVKEFFLVIFTWVRIPSGETMFFFNDFNTATA